LFCRERWIGKGWGRWAVVSSKVLAGIEAVEVRPEANLEEYPTAVLRSTIRVDERPPNIVYEKVEVGDGGVVTHRRSIVWPSAQLGLPNQLDSDLRMAVEALLATGAYSSNVAAKALKSLTTGDELMTTVDRLGLTGTSIEVDPAKLGLWPPTPADDVYASDAATAEAFVRGYAYDGVVNLTTPIDMARYFQLMLQGRLVNERVSGMVRDILARQTIDNRFPALLPDGTRTIHKTGNLELVVHDAGVIDGENGPVILVAMSQAAPDEDRATQIEQRLALIAYGEYDVPAIVPATPEPAMVVDETVLPEDTTSSGGGESVVDEGTWTEKPASDEGYDPGYDDASVDDTYVDDSVVDDTYVEEPYVDDDGVAYDEGYVEGEVDPETNGS
jgi:hypothetical protein